MALQLFLACSSPLKQASTAPGHQHAAPGHQHAAPGHQQAPHMHANQTASQHPEGSSSHSQPESAETGDRNTATRSVGLEVQFGDLELFLYCCKSPLECACCSLSAGQMWLASLASGILCLNGQAGAWEAAWSVLEHASQKFCDQGEATLCASPAMGVVNAARNSLHRTYKMLCAFLCNICMGWYGLISICVHGLLGCTSPVQQQCLRTASISSKSAGRGCFRCQLYAVGSSCAPPHVPGRHGHTYSSA